MKRRPPRLREAALLAALLAALPLRAPAQGADASTPAFDEVTVDLEGALVRQVLPFDVPFVFTGRAPTGVSTIVVRCWELETCRQVRRRDGHEDEKALCAGRSRTATLPADVAGAPNGNCPTWPAPATRGAVDGLPSWTNRVDPGEATPTFSVFVPMLEAERYYTFAFTWDRTPSPEEAAAFAATVAGTADEVLWSVASADGALPASGSLTDDDLAALRTRLVGSLVEVTAADRLQDCTASGVLCPDVPIADVRDEFNALLRDVRNAQGQLEATVRTYKAEVDQLNVGLGRLRGDGELAALLRAGQQVAASTPSLADEMAALQQVLALPDLPDLGPADRRSPQTLATFAAGAAQAAAQGAGRVGTVRSFLATGLLDAQGNPQPAFEAMRDAGALSAEAAASLQAMAAATGRVGSVHRALGRLQGQATDLQSLLGARAAARDTLAEEFRTRAVVVVLLAGTTLADFVTAQKNYLSGDGGLAFAPELDEATSYLGTNIYSRPVNKAASLSQFGNFWQTLDRRLALTLGLTVDGIGDDTTRDDLLGSQSLLVGLGVRLVGSMRLTGGAIVFTDKDPNPLVDDESLTATPFLSLSFDVDVVPALTGLGNAFKSGG